MTMGSCDARRDVSWTQDAECKMRSSGTPRATLHTSTTFVNNPTTFSF